MEEWKDNLTEIDKNGNKRFVSGNKNHALSTIFGIDTEEWETMYISFKEDKEEYKLLQIYESQEEAKCGHIFWAEKVKEGFVPEQELVNNWGKEEMIKFLHLLRKGKYT